MWNILRGEADHKLEVFLSLNTGTKEMPEFKELKPTKSKFKDNTSL